ncbi:MAG TPA: hypothetical protein VF116_14275 [Ktedonobacterales bacterium]
MQPAGGSRQRADLARDAQAHEYLVEQQQNDDRIERQQQRQHAGLLPRA